MASSVDINNTQTSTQAWLLQDQDPVIGQSPDGAISLHSGSQLAIHVSPLLTTLTSLDQPLPGPQVLPSLSLFLLPSLHLVQWYLIA